MATTTISQQADQLLQWIDAAKGTLRNDEAAVEELLRKELLPMLQAVKSIFGETEVDEIPRRLVHQPHWTSIDIKPTILTELQRLLDKWQIGALCDYGAADLEAVLHIGLNRPNQQTEVGFTFHLQTFALIEDQRRLVDKVVVGLARKFAAVLKVPVEYTHVTSFGS